MFYFIEYVSWNKVRKLFIEIKSFINSIVICWSFKNEFAEVQRRLPEDQRTAATVALIARAALPCVAVHVGPLAVVSIPACAAAAPERMMG